MLTRRSFLVGVGAGLIAPRLLDQLRDYLETHNRPLIEARSSPRATLHIDSKR